MIISGQACEATALARGGRSPHRDSQIYAHLGLSRRPLARKTPPDFPELGQGCSTTVPARAGTSHATPSSSSAMRRPPARDRLRPFSPTMRPGIPARGSAGTGTAAWHDRVRGQSEMLVCSFRQSGQWLLSRPQVLMRLQLNRGFMAEAGERVCCARVRAGARLPTCFVCLRKCMSVSGAVPPHPCCAEPEDAPAAPRGANPHSRAAGVRGSPRMRPLSPRAQPPIPITLVPLGISSWPPRWFGWRGRPAPEAAPRAGGAQGRGCGGRRARADPPPPPPPPPQTPRWRPGEPQAPKAAPPKGDGAVAPQGTTRLPSGQRALAP